MEGGQNQRAGKSGLICHSSSSFTFGSNTLCSSYNNNNHLLPLSLIGIIHGHSFKKVK